MAKAGNYRDLGLPDAWSAIAFDLSPADRSRVALEPPLVLQRFEASMSRLDPRDREILYWRAADETLASIGTLIGTTRERVRQLERRALKRLGAEGEMLWSDVTDWTFDEGRRGAVVLRLRDDVTADLGVLGKIGEPGVWRTVTRIMKGNSYRATSLIPVGDERFLFTVVDLDFELPDRWLREHGTFATAIEIESHTGVPAALVLEAPRAFPGLAITRSHLVHSTHFSLVQLGRAIAVELQARGVREWHFSQLAALVRIVQPRRYRRLTPRDVAAMLTRPNVAFFEQAGEPGFWRLRDSIDDTLDLDEPGDPLPAVQNEWTPGGGDGGNDTRVPGNDLVLLQVQDIDAPNPTESSTIDDESEGLGSAILNVLAESERPLTPNMIAARLGRPPVAVRRYIYRVLARDALVKTDDGRAWYIS